MVNVATGNTSCEATDQSPPDSRVAVPGRIPGNRIPDAKMVMRMTPVANSGTDVVIVLSTETLRSRMDPSRMPATTPKTTERGAIMRNAMNASTVVLRRRSQMNTFTGVRHRCE